jgi:HSP20 family protein
MDSAWSIMSLPKKPAPTSLAALTLLQREVNQIFERLAGFEPAADVSGAEWTPPVDVYERGGKLVVVVEVPGLEADHLKVICRERELRISGARRDKRPTGVAAFLCMERPVGRFARTLSLDVAVDVRQAEASLAGGLLTITLPRLKDRRGRETVIPVSWDREAS